MSEELRLPSHRSGRLKYRKKTNTSNSHTFQ